MTKRRKAALIAIVCYIAVIAGLVAWSGVAWTPKVVVSIVLGTIMFATILLEE